MRSKRTSIRIPTELHTWLVKRAESESRTVSNLIVLLLEQARGEKLSDTHSDTNRRDASETPAE